MAAYLPVMRIGRDEVLRRAATLWRERTVPYNMGRLHNGWRTDCSGFVSMCWNVPDSVGHGFWGGLSTVTLVSSGLALKIPKDQLEPGDAVGFLGEGSDGPNGHVVLFAGWTDAGRTRYWAYEQHGPTNPTTYGPVHRVITYGYWGRPSFAAYRYRDITGAPLGGPPVAPPWPGRIFRYTPGAREMQGEDIRRWQQRMRDRGWKDRNGDMLGVDGEYGVLSADVCRKFQAQKDLPVNGEVGRADWTAAWTAPVTLD